MATSLNKSYWTLFFESRVAENAFLHRRRGVLRENVARCSMIMTLGSLLILCFALQSLEVLRTYAFYKVALAAFSIHILLWIILLVVSRCSCAETAMSDRTFEIIVLSTVVVDSFCPYLSDGWYAAKITGVHPHEVHWTASGEMPTFSDTRVLLFIANLLAVAHIVLPLRWILLVPVEILTIAIYAAAVLTDFSPSHWTIGVLNLWLLTTLTIMLSLGRRTIESYEREAQIDLISEKVARCKSEFRVSQLESECSSEKVVPCQSQSSTHPSTTNTGRILSSDASWESIVELGKRERWLLHASELVFHHEDELGGGSFGLVIGAKFHGAEVAVKFPWGRGEICETDNSVKSVLNELRILRHLRHPNMISLIGAYIDFECGEFGLVLEMLHGVSLDRFVLEKLAPGDESVRERTKLIVDIGCALQYLHSRNPCVVHGDLKNSNILVIMVCAMDGRFLIVAKILDFGLSRLLTRHACPLGGSLRWVAPEVALGRLRPACSADIFSFGKVMFLIVSGLLPEASKTDEEMRLALSQGKVSELPWPDDCITVRRFKGIAVACLNTDPESRPTVSDVLHMVEFDSTTYLDAIEAYASVMRNASGILTPSCPEGADCDESKPGISL
eukprot:TRINITY_DN10703_c0_g1_i3.p1 TRINITY_DN10703_c0_g1~~TRINITY_DN10703_c0_g1_i3.p1  ORF type:complete len:618 (+),score=62.85 TRINITY_DN10703_c0_g1_i3:223-2076(+)